MSLQRRKSRPNVIYYYGRANFIAALHRQSVLMVHGAAAINIRRYFRVRIVCKLSRSHECENYFRVNVKRKSLRLSLTIVNTRRSALKVDEFFRTRTFFKCEFS